MLRDRRGTAALEFVLVAAPIFLAMFLIFDLGRYAATITSLRTLASTAARTLAINCYQTAKFAGSSPASCIGGHPYPFTSNSDKQSVAPFLFAGGVTPQTAVTLGASSTLTVTASLPGFTMIMPIWGTSLNAPTASVSLPY